MRAIAVSCLAMLLTTSAWAEDDEKIEVNALVAPISPDVLVIREDGQRPPAGTLNWPLRVTRANIVHLKLDSDPPVYIARDEALTVDDAIKHYDEKIAEVGEEVESADWFVLRGDCHMHEEDYLRGTSDYLYAYRLKPDEESYAIKAIAGCQETQHYQRALRICDELLHKKPDLALAHYGRGQALSGLRDFQGAIAAFDHAILLKPKDADFYNRRSMTRLVTRDYELAIRDSRKAIELDPSGEKYAMGTMAHVVASDTQGALECIREGLATDPSNETLIFIYLAILSESRQEHLLEEKYRQYASVTAMLHFLKAARAFQEDRIDSALYELNEGIDRQSELMPMLLTLRAAVLWNKGDREAAITDLDSAIEQDPKLAGALANRGEYRLAMGDLKAARIDFKRAIRIDAASANAYLGLAEIHRLEGDKNAEREMLSTARNAVPEDLQVALSEAKFHVTSGASATAVSECTKVLSRLSAPYERKSGIVKLTERGFKIGLGASSLSTPEKSLYLKRVKALTLRSYAQAQQANYADALADAWQVCTLPVVSK